MDARIILISGACGTGKTTVARLLAERAAAARAVHLHTDDFYGCIRKGYIPPWQAGSKAQNETASAAAAAAAEQFAAHDKRSLPEHHQFSFLRAAHPIVPHPFLR